MAKKPMMKKDGMHRMPDGTMMKDSDMKKKENTASGLTAAQKKLPPALQAAILKKMKKK
jgi:hypothetical protein